ncbi:MAG: hypothetical protein QM628_17355 [Propionicimonas sp.]
MTLHATAGVQPAHWPPFPDAAMTPPSVTTPVRWDGQISRSRPTPNAAAIATAASIVSFLALTLGTPTGLPTEVEILAGVRSVWYQADPEALGSIRVAPTESELVSKAKELSGLTWEQLATAFGVSRRTVHLWAAGGKMNSRHASLLHQLMTEIETSGQNDPLAVRGALMSSRRGEPSVLEQLGQRASPDASLITRSTLSAIDLLGE